MLFFARFFLFRRQRIRIDSNRSSQAAVHFIPPCFECKEFLRFSSANSVEIPSAGMVTSRNCNCDGYDGEMPCLRACPVQTCCARPWIVGSGGYGAYIDGQWAAALDGRTFDVADPSSGEVIGSVPDMGADDVHAAVCAADRAFLSWKALTAGSAPGFCAAGSI